MVGSARVLCIGGLLAAYTWCGTQAAMAQTSKSGKARGSNLGSSFVLETLPLGADVTLPGPATTLIALSSRVTLSATDTPQTLSFTSVNANGASSLTALRLAIYDRNQERVKYVELKPGTPFLYSFKTLASIAVVPEIATGTAKSQESSVKLQVESDKPLTIAR